MGVTKEKVVERNLPDMRCCECEWATLMTGDEFYPRLVGKRIRPAKWSGKAVQAELQGLRKDPRLGAHQRFVSLINQDCGTATTPGFVMSLQIMNPGERIAVHRHNSAAVYHIERGRGYSVFQAPFEYYRIEWEAGDTFLCPPWYYQEHCCLGDEPALMYVVQDLALLAHLQALMWEEPAGAEFIRQVRAGFTPPADTGQDE